MYDEISYSVFAQKNKLVLSTVSNSMVVDLII